MEILTDKKWCAKLITVLSVVKLSVIIFLIKRGDGMSVPDKSIDPKLLESAKKEFLANGFEKTSLKAICDGASELDMVINITDVKNGDYEAVEKEIRTLKEVAADKILKVIIETCYLTEEEKIAMCHAVTNAGADYIKTSTGFGTGGATMEDVLLFKENIEAGVKIKAAGGIRSVEDMEAFLDAGCDRLGTSSAVSLINENQAADY